MTTKLRNIAIIAHVDHGKTTLVDNLLAQSGTFRSHQNVSERVMDSNDQEKERGITILAKCTSLTWQNTRINIVDTPGHADFGSEVERTLGMVDGVVLLVDAAEGPMPQTKFVLTKALSLGLKPIVVINKIDRQDQRAEEVLDEVLELFIALDANDDQLDFAVIYASGRSGWAKYKLDDPEEDLSPLFETICKYIPAPKIDVDADFTMLATMREYNSYLGRLLTGRIHTGKIKVGDQLKAINGSGELVEKIKISKLFAFRGINKEPVEQAESGDIIAIAGVNKASVADTICSLEEDTPIPSRPIDPSTLVMTFAVNNSPMSGREGKKLTSRVIQERLMHEAECNIAIKVAPTEDNDAFEVSGRGELQLGVFIETMRREGFELSISKPKVVIKKDDSGNKLEPMEEILVDVDEEFVGVVVEALNNRKCEMRDMKSSGGNKTRITFHGPSRGLIGYHNQFLTETRGTGLMNRSFIEYGPYKGTMPGRHNGVLIASANGKTTAYALFNLQDRGKMLISHDTEVYQGMIIGEHNRENDLEVNPLKAKQLTNVRASGKDEALDLVPPMKMTLEKAMSYIEDDELLEVTPLSIRLRKRHLDPVARKRLSR